MKQANTKVHTGSLDVDLSLASTQPALLGISDTHMSIDPSRPGKQRGHLSLPFAGPHGLSQLRVPVCSIRGQAEGPTVTLLAGIHGDEYEGVMALSRLCREIRAEAVHGCLIMAPALNIAGLATANRCLPQSGEDLDLCFPGQPDGSLGQRLAREIIQHLVRPADLVLDLRSGGGRLRFAPSAVVRNMGVSKARQRTNMGVSNDTDTEAADANTLSEAAMVAFGAPNCVRLPASTGTGCLQASVTALGKACLQTELGGGGGCQSGELSIADIGIRNVLRYMGVLDEQIQLRASRMLEVRDERFFVYATASGLLAPHAAPGSEVWQGDTLASIVDLQQDAAEPSRIHVPRNAVLLAVHHGGPVQAGDLIAILADEVQR